MSQTFVATVVPAGNATGVEVPAEVVDALRGRQAPPVTITVNGRQRGGAGSLRRTA